MFLSDPTDGTHGVIRRLAPDGTEYPLFATGLVTPEGLAFDSAGKNLFVADYGANAIYKFPLDGSPPTTFATAVASCSPPPCQTGPQGLAFDTAGNLFVSDGFDGARYTTTIHKFDRDGNKTVFHGQADCSSNFSDCRAYTGLAFDNAGNLFAANDDYRTRSVNSIDKFAPDGTPSSFATGLRYPVGLAFNNAGDLFVADEDASEI